MGRKTFESFGSRPLPQRTNIIVTRDANYQADGALVVTSIEDAITAAADSDELMVIGGASFYAQMLERADTLYVTEVQGEFSGDAWFPEFDITQWIELSREIHQADEKNAYSCHFITYERA
jgi:dihydrofolate reductase